MNEHGFIKAVHRHLPLNVFKWKIHDTYTGGVPDAFYAGPAGILFCEYKYLKKLPKKSTTPVNIGLSPLQINWLQRITSCSIKALVIVGFEDKAIILLPEESDNVYIDKFNHSSTFREVADNITRLVTYDTDTNKPKKNLG